MKKYVKFSAPEKDDAKRMDLTPEKVYEVIGNIGGCPQILDDIGYKITIAPPESSFYCGHLQNTFWQWTEKDVPNESR